MGVSCLAKFLLLAIATISLLIPVEAAALPLMTVEQKKRMRESNERARESARQDRIRREKKEAELIGKLKKESIPKCETQNDVKYCWSGCVHWPRWKDCKKHGRQQSSYELLSDNEIYREMKPKCEGEEKGHFRGRVLCTCNDGKVSSAKRSNTNEMMFADEFLDEYDEYEQEDAGATAWDGAFDYDDEMYGGDNAYTDDLFTSMQQDFYLRGYRQGYTIAQKRFN
eukprot:CAMPEP_0202691248 /NCGR_PEP_ID=MMETSP1385-20130828/6013_1 /ASSEMBLY_ACC=CAM_ASM_000861 /TAXON_ID=933848 /ORGANISM="Elphidium margaritaceum" /LENGTH=225 /DNA_ID=CAMNT_0049346621 /DNA_START=33 /DNA_END=710 /DNA_ORIENTATION=+